MTTTRQLYLHEIVFGGGEKWKTDIPAALYDGIVRYIRVADASVVGILGLPDKMSDFKRYQIGYVNRFELVVASHKEDITSEISDCADRYKLTYTIVSEPAEQADYERRVAKVREISPYFYERYL